MNSNYIVKDAKYEDGHPLFIEKNLLKDKRKIDLGNILEVHVKQSSVILLVSKDNPNKYIVSDRIKFGIDKNNELVCIVIDSLNNTEINWIKNELQYML